MNEETLSELINLMFYSEAEEAVEQEDWRRQRSESSTAMDEIETTYVPTAMVIDSSKFTNKVIKFFVFSIWYILLTKEKVKDILNDDNFKKLF